MSEVYLSGEAPHVTKVDGTPTSVKVRVLDRVNSTLVAELMSDIDGSWRVDGINPTRTYDIIFSHDGYKDEIISDVKPIGYTGGVIEPFDPYWDNVVSLMHFDGDLTDETGRGEYEGSGVVFTQGRFGQGCVFTSTSGPVVELVSDSSDFLFGASDFTVEGWLNDLGNVQDESNIVSLWNHMDNVRSWLVGKGVENIFRAGVTSHPVNIVNRVYVTTTDYPKNGWFHFAFVRRSNNLILFIDGEEKDRKTFTGAAYASPLLKLGIGNYQSGSTYGYLGKIDELRITKGVARYTENFTPPTEPFPNRGP